MVPTLFIEISILRFFVILLLFFKSSFIIFALKRENWMFPITVIVVIIIIITFYYIIQSVLTKKTAVDWIIQFLYYYYYYTYISCLFLLFHLERYTWMMMIYTAFYTCLVQSLTASVAMAIFIISEYSSWKMVLEI